MVDNPSPRDRPLVYEPYVWSDEDQVSLPPPTDSVNNDLIDVLANRQTRREFPNDISDNLLSDFLWLACRNRSSRPSDFGFDQEFRVEQCTRYISSYQDQTEPG